MSARAIAVLVYAGAALIVLGRAGIWRAGSNATLLRRGTWFLAVAMAITTTPRAPAPDRGEIAATGSSPVLPFPMCRRRG